MSHVPFAAWPDEIPFRVREIEILLDALDLAVEITGDQSVLRRLRRAQVVIWRTLWPELADQYEEFGDEAED